MKPNVLILYTGGTIGMRMSEQGYVPCARFSQLLQEKLPEATRSQLPDYSVLELSELIDSANLQPVHWTEMAGHLLSRWDQYDGFVVLHGTDTMDYTAAALSFMLMGLDKPVILTGSQVPLVQARSDGLDNLVTAIELAGSCAVAEVCIYFNNRLLRGNRSVKLDSNAFDAFDSPNFPPLARAGVRVTVDTHLQLSRSEKCFRAPKYNPDAVTIIPMYPGVSARVIQTFMENPDVKGVIVLSYGAGNIPDNNRELVDCLTRLSDRGVVLVNVTQCVEGPVSQGDYATGSELNKMGVVSGKDITLAAAFAKLHYLVATESSADDIRQKMSIPMSGEMST